jgi:hypothetical protein
LDRSGKKTAAAIHQEITREVNLILSRIFAELRWGSRVDLEAVENAFRTGLHQAGASALTEVLQFAVPDAEHRQLLVPAEGSPSYVDMRSKTVLTMLGEARVVRPYYLCSHCHQGQSPADAELDIAETGFSPGVRRMQALVGQEAPFEHGREQLKLLAGLDLTTKSVERVAEAIGADVARREQQEIDRALQLELPLIVGEPVPILYVQMDGTSVPVVKKDTAGHTREVKLGCVFTQAKWDQEGYAIRDTDSTTYTGAIETAEQFGKRRYVEAWKRGWSRAEKKVVIGDGAEWIWNIAQEHFPGAIQIVDLFHARQHLWEIARLLYPTDTKRRNAWIGLHQKRWLDQGKIAKFVASLRAIQTTDVDLAKKLRNEADYFAHNAARMNYPHFRKHIGSGVIEAGCKTVVGNRLKQSGMFWTVKGANSILALRCCHLNGRFEDYWEGRRAA